MNRGRFIGLASLPVWLLGAPCVASEVKATDAAPAPAASNVATVDAAWAERWKVAAAELAARKVAQRDRVVGEAKSVPAFQKVQLLSMQQRRRVRRPGATDAPVEGAAAAEAAPAEAAPAEAPAEGAPAPTDAAPAPTEAPAPAPVDAGAAVPGATEGVPDNAPAAIDAPPVNPGDELVPIDEPPPFGYADSPVQESFNKEQYDHSNTRSKRVAQADFLPLPDRFRIGLPENYVQNVRGSLFDPYNQNVLKGDYPIIDNHGHHDDYFMILTLTSDTLVEARRLPVPTPVSSNDPGQFGFFDDTGHQQLINQNFVATIEFFEGDTVYKPRDFEIRATVVGNINYLHTEQQQVVNADFREGSDRYDEEFAVQELFYEKHLADLSNSYDLIALRVGMQGFNSDFRGFLFSDNLPGIRLFGNYDNNTWQYNVAYFRQVEKDTNSGLNTFNDRNQNIFVANVFRQDFLFPGYTAQLSLHYNNDHSSNDPEFDRNGFLVRPAPVGTIGTNEIDVVYLGWAGDGHIGRLNLSHQVYQALGRESFNPIAGSEVDVNAQFAAIELSYDVDYIRYRSAFAYASGDSDPDDNSATGFDGIFDNTNFAGGGFTYFIRQPVRLTGSGVGLKQRLSLYNNLRTSKEQGQANFVNPGLLMLNVGADIEVTPKLKVVGNASYLRFVDTSSTQLLLQDNMLDEEIGVDLSVGVIYRPFLNQNVILTGGAACLIPGQGFEDIYSNETLYSFFTALTLTY
jgi:hypothetical protein